MVLVFTLQEKQYNIDARRSQKKELPYDLDPIYKYIQSELITTRGNEANENMTLK